MPDPDLDALGKDIKENGLRSPITVDRSGTLLDGRNRLEAMERAGLESPGSPRRVDDDPLAYIVSANLRRRHLTKGQIADLIVALARIEVERKPGQHGPVFTGGRGKRSPVKAKALAINSTLPNEARVSPRTLKRSIARSEGRSGRSARLPKAIAYGAGLHAPIDPARRAYLVACENVDDLDAELEIIIDALREIAGNRAMARQAAKDEGFPNLPDFLDRRPNKEVLAAE
jgi:hypothetical protein